MKHELTLFRVVRGIAGSLSHCSFSYWQKFLFAFGLHSNCVLWKNETMPSVSHFLPILKRLPIKNHSMFENRAEEAMPFMSVTKKEVSKLELSNWNWHYCHFIYVQTIEYWECWCYIWKSNSKEWKGYMNISGPLNNILQWYYNLMIWCNVNTLINLNSEHKVGKLLYHIFM